MTPPPAAVRPLTSRDPEHLGDHRLLGRLGEGGQGIVYLAEDPAGARVALKVLHDRGASPTAFLKEISAARRVAAFCTAEIRHVGEDDGIPYVVTEFIDGPSLRDLVQEKGAQSGPSLYRLAVGTATALAAIHEAGIVHRDFKPGNVLVGPDGPRVIDFGVARSLDATVTATSTVIGPPSYMAPEQLAGDPAGPAADVFAWGSTIAYAANGRPPYGQDTVPAVMNRILKGKPDLGALSGPLRDLVIRALHKDPSKRPAARDVLLHLLEHSQGPISAPEALAQGRALAMADDETLTTDRTARWTTLKLPAQTPKRPAFQRAALVTGILATTALLVTTVALAITRDSSDRSTTAAPKPETERSTSRQARQAAPEAAPPTTPSTVAAAVQKAIATHKTARFSADGAIAQGDDAFTARGRLHYQSEEGTNYDLTVHNRNAPSQSTQVFFIEECIYLRDTPQYCQREDKVDDDPDTDLLIWLARQARWISSPENTFALIRNSKSLSSEPGAGAITYRGVARIEALAAGPAAPFYGQYSSNSAKLSYKLVTDSNHLPERLDIEFKITYEPNTSARSLYSVTYRGRGRSPQVDAPTITP